MLLALAAVTGAPLCAQDSKAPPQEPAQAATPATSSEPPAQQGGIITGTVTAATAAAANGKSQPGTPLPGVTVTATQSLTGKKYAAATDVNGTFRLLIPRNGRYVLRTEFAGFAPLTSEVLLNDSSHTGTSNFTLQLASRVAARASQAGGANAEAAAGFGSALGLSGAQTQALQRGLQSLRGAGTDAQASSDAGGNSGPSLNTLAGLDSSGADSVAVTGQSGQTNGMAGFNEDEVRNRIEGAIAEARRNGGQQADIANAVVGLVGSMMGGPGGFGGPGGGRGGPGGGGGPFRVGGGGGGRGGFRNFNPTQVHGNLFYQGGNGALDATQFSLTGTPIQPAYSTNRFGLNLTGSPYIPGLIKPSTKQFGFLNITGQRNETPTNIAGTVPTDAVRTGDFSGFTRTVSGVSMPVVIFDPVTGAPFGCASAAIYAANPACATNVIPANRISPQALALLNLYPHANQANPASNNTGEVYNYQRVTTAGQNQLQISARFVRNFGNAPTGRGGFGGMFGGGGGRQQPGQKPSLRQNINTNFSYSHSGNDIRAFAPSLDGKSFSDGMNAGVGYSIGYGRFNSNASINFNRAHATTQNLFTGGAVDPGSGLNIPKPTPLAPGFYNGVPTIGLSNFNSLSDTLPQDRVQQTFSFGDQVRWNHKKHNLNIGFDARRVQNNIIGSTNVLGSFTFSGVYTQDPSLTGAGGGSTGTGNSTGTASGSSFADFLLGAPQQTSIQAGLNKTHLRETVVNAYGFDDFRALPNLTLNLGLRYEYFSPYYETNNQLVNLDHSPDFSVVTPVQPDGTGPYSGKFPRSLVNPDRTMFSPRLGLAWRPKGNSNFAKNTVIRAGYGINYNTTAFGSFANSLSYQTPFAITQTNIASVQNSNDSGCGTFTTPGTVNRSNFTLTNGFNCTSKAVTNNFAINRDYRLGRVQVFNFGIQHTFGFGILLNVDYNGSLGSNLDIVSAPGATAQGLALQNAQGFTFENSVADSRSNGLFVSARKRMSRGISLQATYTYSHGIDNASTLSGGGGTVAQNFQRLDLEYGNSSFDVRHRATGNWVLELPFGENRAFLNKGGWLSYALNGFNLSGNFTFATGGYATPQYQNTAAQLVTGGNYTLRPDRVFSQPISGAGSLRNWFNPHAFTDPANVFGTSSRNSIQLPGTVSTDTSLSRDFAFGDLKNLEFRATATNVFNTVQYSGVNTVLNSATFGQVSSVAQARRLSFQARYRF